MVKPLLLFSLSVFASICCSAQLLEKSRVADYFQQQQYDEAIAYLQPLLAAEPTNQQALAYDGYAKYMADRPEAAEQSFAKLYLLDSNNVFAIHYLFLLNSIDKPLFAKIYLQKLLNLEPARPAWYREMGVLLRKNGQQDSAISYYAHAYALAPQDTRNGSGFAELLIDTKNYAQADSIIKTGLDADSLNIPYLRLLIRSAFESKNYRRALDPGERLIRTGDISLAALTQLALSYYNLNAYAEGIRVFEFMLSKDLTTESVYYYEAKCQAKLKQFAKSNELLEVCLAHAISKSAELYYYNLAENAEAVGHFKSAVANYDTAFYLFKNPLMKYNAGRIYEVNLKNAAMARRCYLQYLSLAKPQSKEEQKAYAYVKYNWGRKKSR